jgi:hypothetical protein
MMVSKPKAAKAAQVLRGTGVGAWGCGTPWHHIITDPAVGSFQHTQFFLQLDKPTQNKLMAAKLDAEAAVHKTVADAHTQIANILKTRG